MHRVGGGGGGGRVFSALEELGRVLGHLERLGRVVLGVGWSRIGRGIVRSRVVVAEGGVRRELAALGVFAARGRFVIQLVAVVVVVVVVVVADSVVVAWELN